MINPNTVQGKSWTIPVPCSHPTTPAAYDPVRFGEITGVALYDEGDQVPAATDTAVYFGPCTGDFSVKGVDGVGNVAVSPGDLLYYTDADTPVLNKKTTGRLFGVALASIASGATATISVFKLPAGMK